MKLLQFLKEVFLTLILLGMTAIFTTILALPLGLSWISEKLSNRRNP